MNDIIISIPPHVATWNPFLPPLAGSLVGVLLAYVLAKGTERYLNVQRRTKWLESIRWEINQIHSDLTRHERFHGTFFAAYGELLKSLVSSTDLNLFEANERVALSQLYSRLDSYNKNIEGINNRIEQLKYFVNSENPEFASLLEEMDDLIEEQQKNGNNIQEIQDKINKLNDKKRGRETYSEVNIGIHSVSGSEYSKRMKHIIETYQKQEWINNERRCHFFPKHMSESDEELLRDLTKIPLVSGST